MEAIVFIYIGLVILIGNLRFDWGFIGYELLVILLGRFISIFGLSGIS